MKKNTLLLIAVLLILVGTLCSCKGTTDSNSGTNALNSAHKDNMGDKTGDFTYRDEEEQLLLSYPNVFSDQGVMENGTVRFAAQQDGLALLYWVTPNTYGENPAAFIERVTAEGLQELEGNVVIGKSKDLDQKTGEVTPCACYWVVDADFIVNVAILCGSSEESSEWYDSLKEGAVYIESVAGID
ncbi:MAG: hypothetical protein WC147_06330 [Syntrophomonas sp.]